MHHYSAEKQHKWHKHNLMSLNSLLLGSASFPHCFNKTWCLVLWYLGHLGAPGRRFRKLVSWVGAGQASQWETWLLKKSSVHRKEMLWRSHRCKFSSNIVNVKWVSQKRRLQTGHVSMKWDLPSQPVPLQTWNRVPHHHSGTCTHFVVSKTNQKCQYFILN